MTIAKVGLAAALALVGLGYGVLAQEQTTPTTPPERAALDKPVKTFALKDIAREPKEGEKEDAAVIDLAKNKDKKNAVLFFMSEKCGTTWKYEKRIGQMLKDFANKDVAFYAVRCSAADSPEGIKKFAETRNIDMPILNDEKGELTKFYGVRNTPAFAVVDKKGVLRFKGGFDDNPDEGGVSKQYLRDAVTAVLDGKPVPVKESRVFG